MALNYIIKASSGASAGDSALTVRVNALEAEATSRVGACLNLNGTFRINQRVYVSGTSLALNAYCFDRWKATTASTVVTFTAAPQGQIVTITAGSLGSIQPREDLPAGTVTMSWEGTAQGRIYNVGSTAPAYANVGGKITVTLDGLANVMMEFSTGTLFRVKLEYGSAKTPYRLPTFADELLACQRYYETSYEYGTPWGTNTAVGSRDQSGASDLAGNIVVPIFFRAQKRVIGTMRAHSGATLGSWSYARSGASGTAGVTTAYRASTLSSNLYLNVGVAYAPCNAQGHWDVDAEY